MILSLCIWVGVPECCGCVFVDLVVLRGVLPVSVLILLSVFDLAPLTSL